MVRAAAGNWNDMVEGGKKFPIRRMGFVHFPVAMKREGGRQHNRQQAENRWKQEPIPRVAINETVADEHSKRLRFSEFTSRGRRSKKRILPPRDC